MTPDRTNRGPQRSAIPPKGGGSLDHGSCRGSDQRIGLALGPGNSGTFSDRSGSGTGSDCGSGAIQCCGSPAVPTRHRGLAARVVCRAPGSDVREVLAGPASAAPTSVGRVDPRVEGARRSSTRSPAHAPIQPECVATRCAALPAHLAGNAMNTTARCEGCGEEYRRRRRWQRFCSGACRWRGWSREHPRTQDQPAGSDNALPDRGSFFSGRSPLGQSGGATRGPSRPSLDGGLWSREPPLDELAAASAGAEAATAAAPPAGCGTASPVNAPETAGDSECPDAPVARAAAQDSQGDGIPLEALTERSTC